MCKIDEYIANQTPKMASIVDKLRSIILSCGVGIQESIKYKIPFYSRYSNVCYINVRMNRVVDLGFPKGSELSNYDGILEGKKRVNVKTVSFQSIHEINEELIKIIITEALLIDEEQSYTNKKDNNTR